MLKSKKLPHSPGLAPAISSVNSPGFLPSFRYILSLPAHEAANKRKIMGNPARLQLWLQKSGKRLQTILFFVDCRRNY